MSRSMLFDGFFNAAKRVSLALESRIRGKYPRDQLTIIGFSYLAQEIKPAELPSLDWNEYNYGTNMQHGFQLARQALNREKGANKQIIVITDGEPTAHFDDGHVRFNYPPTPRPFQETLREVIRLGLEEAGYRVVLAEDGPSALIAFASSPPDLVLLDVMMPDLNGMEVTRRLRSEPDTARLPIIMLTAKSDTSDVVKGLESGADDLSLIHISEPTRPY